MKEQTKGNKHKRISRFEIVNDTLIVVITFIIAYPLFFCVVASFSDPTQVTLGKTLFWVKDFTVEAYKNILAEKKLWIGYRNTIIYTVLGTLYNLILTIPSAYVLTKKYMPFRTLFSWYFFITMYIGGGLIPGYLLMKNLNLINNPLVMILGAGVSCYNLIVTRQYFQTAIPQDIYEAAYIDGASELKCFTGIALPLSKAILAVMTLYYGVGHWNSYYGALIYLRDEKLFPLQLVLRNILIVGQKLTIESNADTDTVKYLLHRVRVAQGMKYSIIFIASLPLLIAYPFVQKHFAKGVMIGGVKG